MLYSGSRRSLIVPFRSKPWWKQVSLSYPNLQPSPLNWGSQTLYIFCGELFGAVLSPAKFSWLCPLPPFGGKNRQILGKSPKTHRRRPFWPPSLLANLKARKQYFWECLLFSMKTSWLLPLLGAKAVKTVKKKSKTRIGKRFTLSIALIKVEEEKKYSSRNVLPAQKKLLWLH